MSQLGEELASPALGKVLGRSLSGAFLAAGVSSSEVYHVALTGGPCGGKSTALSIITEKLGALGYTVFAVPEVATLLHNGGASFRPEMTTQQLISFEASVMKAQIALEDSFLEVARACGSPSVVISDRGTMDVQAYMSKHDWQLLLNVEHWQVSELRERYTAVFHLVTSAIGAEEFYTKSNNDARRESLEEARALDHVTRSCWLGHPRLKIFGNTPGEAFMDKIQHVVDAMLGVVGLPTPVQHERRFLVSLEHGRKAMGLSEWAVEEDGKRVCFEEFDTVIHYLVPVQVDGSAAPLNPRLMQRSHNGAQTYHYSLKKDISNDGGDVTHQIVNAQMLSGKEYLQMLSLKDPKHRVIRKRMRCFLYKSVYFTLNHYLGCNDTAEFYLLEAEDSTNRPVCDLLPARLLAHGQFTEVTGQERYTSFGCSLLEQGEWDPYAVALTPGGMCSS